MKSSNWKKRIQIAESLEDISLVSALLVEDMDVSESELEELETLLKEKQDEIIKNSPKRQKKDKEEENSSKPILYDSKLYDRDTEEDKPGYETLMEKGMSFNEFLKNIFYEDFIKLSDPEIQIPICMAVSYLNSMTVPDTVSFPMIYIYSPEENSGKSQLAYHWGDYYHPEYRALFRDAITGAGFRNFITPIANQDQPAIAILDNFHSSTTKQRLGAIGWSSLLSYNRIESKAQMVADQEGGLVKFNTHCLKVFTSITPLGNTVEQSSELKSRCIRIYANKCKEGINLYRTSYNWSGLQKVYFDLWGDPDRCNREFKKGLIKQLLQKSHKDLPFFNREWQISIPLIATGVYAGVWPNIDKAIKHMAIYWEWEKGKKSNKLTPLETILQIYVTEHHPKVVLEHLEEIEGTKRKQSVFFDIIHLNDVYKHLERLALEKTFSEFKRTNANDNLICNIFYSMGFVSEIMRSEVGKPLGIYFYKQ